MNSYAYMNEDGSIHHTSDMVAGVEWGDETIGRVDLLGKAEKIDRRIYEHYPPTNQPGALETVTGTACDIDHESGVVQERHIIEPLPLGEAQARLIQQAKSTAASLLQPTDWKIVRAAEGVQPCGQATLDYRAAVRAACNAFEAAVLASADVGDLAGLSPAWPAP